MIFMFCLQNTTAQFKIIDSLMKSSNKTNLAFVQIHPIERLSLPEARRFDVNSKYMEYIKIYTEPTENIPPDIRNYKNKSSKF